MGDRVEEKSEVLYNDMRGAIQKKNYQQMRKIIGDPDYDPNRLGAKGDKRTALHTAAHDDDREALAILLQQTNIDTNVKTTKGLTPFLYAASRGKMVSFEVLLNDGRVDVDERDYDDQTATELINSLGKEIEAHKAEELLAKAKADKAEAAKSQTAKAEAAIQRTEALYITMQRAIQKKNYSQMRAIIEDPDYNPNRVGALDQRTALHTAAHDDNREALAILLEQTSIDTNVKTTDGLTPFLYAASRGKMVSLEVLLNDGRVDVDERDGKDQTAMELINLLDREIKAHKARELLAERDKKPLALNDAIKLALLIGNSEYQGNNAAADAVTWDDLPGAKKDVTDMEARLKADGYQVELIENSPDILQAVQDVMKKIPVASVTHLQVLYVG